MEQRTKELIEKLKLSESKEVLESTVLKEVDRCKRSLQDRGYRFNPESRTDNLTHEQGVRGRDHNEIKYLDEIVYIKEGITDEWVTKINEQPRFKKISDEVNEILFKFD